MGLRPGALWSVFTHFASICADQLEQKEKRLHKRRLQFPQVWFVTTNMAGVASFWDTNMAAVTSRERGVLEEIAKARNRLLIKQSTQALLLLAVKITGSSYLALFL